MPIHKAFFPETPSKKKAVNETITVPQPVSDAPITIKSDYKPLPKTEIIPNTDKVSDFQYKPVEYAPPPKIISKKNIFFNLY